MATPLQDALQSLLGPAFEIRRELTGGGMSRVFVAYEAALQREVAVKVLPPDLVSTKSVARFRTEIQVTAQLQHPHILPVVTAGGDERLLFYIVPLVTGGSLRDRLASGDRPAFSDAIQLAGELLSAVAFAHDRGVIHRDIKPGNVLLSQGHAILADFGIARALEAIHDGDATGTGTSVATPAQYLAPERPRGAPADLYAVAVLTCEMLSGQLPNPDVSADAVEAAVRATHPSADRAQVGAAAQALSRALARDPARRFARAADFRTALTAAARSSRKFTGIAIAASLVAVAALGAWGVKGWSEPEAGAASAPVPAETATIRPDVPAAVMAQAIAHESPKPESRQPKAESRRLPTRADTAVAQLNMALQAGWSWNTVAIDSATRAALRALDYKDALDPHQVAVATGLAALGRSAFPEACAAFDSARAIREDFHSWMGTAECRVRDSVVILDINREQQFRSSLYEATKAYLEAGRRASPDQLSPSYGRLTTVAFTDPNRVRRGFTADGTGVVGQHIAMADSFTTVIIPPGPRRVTPESMAQTTRASTIARSMVRPALVTWTRRDTANVRARELLIELLEVQGNIREADTDGVTALREIFIARNLPGLDSVSATRLGRMHVRILLKAKEFAAASALADTLLGAAPATLSDPQADALIGLAMLTGRASRATAMLQQLSASPTRQIRLPDGRPIEIQPALLRDRAAFVIASALGICDDQVRAAPAQLQSMLDALYQGGNRPRGLEQGVLERPLLLALPCLGLESVRTLREPNHPMARALVALAGGSRQEMEATLGQMKGGRAMGFSRFESAEGMLLESYGYLMLGDSASANATLGLVLDALPAQPQVALNNEVLAGGLVRLMVLRAELAVAAGDKAMARQWAGAVVALWGKADAPLQPVVARMRLLLSS